MMDSNSSQHPEASLFHQLFDAYKNRVFGYVMTITHSHHAAEEITQELFIKLWTSRHLLEEVKNFDQYIFVMARHFAINYLRKSTADEKKREALYNRIKTAYFSAEDQLIEKEYQAILAEAVSKLSPQRRHVYELSRNKGLSLEEIASELNLSRNTVKNHLVEALKQVREQLSRHGIGIVLLFTVMME